MGRVGTSISALVHPVLIVGGARVLKGGVLTQTDSSFVALRCGGEGSVPNFAAVLVAARWLRRYLVYSGAIAIGMNIPVRLSTAALNAVGCVRRVRISFFSTFSDAC